MLRKKNNRRKVRGSIGAVDAIIVFGLLAFVATVVWPFVGTFMEGRKAADISAGFNTVIGAAQKSPFGQSSDYSGIDYSSISSFLPRDFTQRAVNGQDFSVTANTNDSLVDVSLTITDARLRDQVVANFRASQVSVTGSVVTVTSS